jgi:hypothetical protein
VLAATLISLILLISLGYQTNLLSKAIMVNHGLPFTSVGAHLHQSDCRYSNAGYSANVTIDRQQMLLTQIVQRHHW